MYELDLNKEITAVGSENSGTSRTEFTYDGMDRRIRIVEKTHNGSTWTTGSDNVFVWDGSEIVQKRDVTGSIVGRKKGVKRRI